MIENAIIILLSVVLGAAGIAAVAISAAVVISYLIKKELL